MLQMVPLELRPYKAMHPLMKCKVHCVLEQPRPTANAAELMRIRKQASVNTPQQEHGSETGIKFPRTRIVCFLQTLRLITRHQTASKCTGQISCDDRLQGERLQADSPCQLILSADETAPAH